MAQMITGSESKGLLKLMEDKYFKGSPDISTVPIETIGDEDTGEEEQKVRFADFLNKQGYDTKYGDKKLEDLFTEYKVKQQMAEKELTTQKDIPFVPEFAEKFFGLGETKPSQEQVSSYIKKSRSDYKPATLNLDQLGEDQISEIKGFIEDMWVSANEEATNKRTFNEGYRDRVFKTKLGKFYPVFQQIDQRMQSEQAPPAATEVKPEGSWGEVERVYNPETGAFE